MGGTLPSGDLSGQGCSSSFCSSYTASSEGNAIVAHRLEKKVGYSRRDMGGGQRKPFYHFAGL